MAAPSRVRIAQPALPTAAPTLTGKTDSELEIIARTVLDGVKSTIVSSHDIIPRWDLVTPRREKSGWLNPFEEFSFYQMGTER